MSSITNTLRKQQYAIPNETQYFGFSLSTLPDNANISTHFITVKNDYIQNNSKFNKNANPKKH